MPGAGQLVQAMNNGNGLLDRCVFYVPVPNVPLEPLPAVAKAHLQECSIRTFSPVYAAIQQHHTVARKYALSAEADEYYKGLYSEQVS